MISKRSFAGLPGLPPVTVSVSFVAVLSAFVWFFEYKNIVFIEQLAIFFGEEVNFVNRARLIQSERLCIMWTIQLADLRRGERSPMELKDERLFCETTGIEGEDKLLQKATCC